jgi:crossover junction endodeoxyribonuclease RuvC
MKVLGIDPGFDRLGVAIVERIDGRDSVRFSACLASERGTPLPDRLRSLGEQLTAILEREQPTHLAIETLFFNKNVKTALDVAQARGVMVYLGRRHGCTIHEYSPQAVKLALTGYGSSDKTAVITMTKRLVRGAPTEALDDEYDAIAVGVTCLAHEARGR